MTNKKFRWEYERCFMGATIAHPINCPACGEGPIHPNPRPCGCSFFRRQKLVCRFCALGFDLLTNQHSKIPNPWSVEEIRDLLGLVARGEVVRG